MVCNPAGNCTLVRLFVMLNALDLISVTLSGRLIFDKLVQLLKAYEPMAVMPFGIVTSVRLLQSENRESGTSVKVAGKVTLFRFLQLENASEPKLTTPFGMTTLVNPVLLNAPLPIDVTVSGIVISVKLLHPQNS